MAKCDFSERPWAINIKNAFIPYLGQYGCAFFILAGPKSIDFLCRKERCPKSKLNSTLMRSTPNGHTPPLFVERWAPSQCGVLKENFAEQYSCIQTTCVDCSKCGSFDKMCMLLFAHRVFLCPQYSLRSRWHYQTESLVQMDGWEEGILFARSFSHRWSIWYTVWTPSLWSLCSLPFLVVRSTSYEWYY